MIKIKGRYSKMLSPAMDNTESCEKRSCNSLHPKTPAMAMSIQNCCCTIAIAHLTRRAPEASDNGTARERLRCARRGEAASPRLPVDWILRPESRTAFCSPPLTSPRARPAPAPPRPTAPASGSPPTTRRRSCFCRRADRNFRARALPELDTYCSNPSRAAAEAVRRQWFDWTAPEVTRTSAPASSAYPGRGSLQQKVGAQDVQMICERGRDVCERMNDTRVQLQIAIATHDVAH